MSFHWQANNGAAFERLVDEVLSWMVPVFRPQPKGKSAAAMRKGMWGEPGHRFRTLRGEIDGKLTIAVRTPRGLLELKAAGHAATRPFDQQKE